MPFPTKKKLTTISNHSSHHSQCTILAPLWLMVTMRARLTTAIAHLSAHPWNRVCLIGSFNRTIIVFKIGCTRNTKFTPLFVILRLQDERRWRMTMTTLMGRDQTVAPKNETVYGMAVWRNYILLPPKLIYLNPSAPMRRCPRLQYSKIQCQSSAVSWEFLSLLQWPLRQN